MEGELGDYDISILRVPQIGTLQRDTARWACLPPGPACGRKEWRKQHVAGRRCAHRDRERTGGTRGREEPRGIISGREGVLGSCLQTPCVRWVGFLCVQGPSVAKLRPSPQRASSEVQALAS